LWLFPIARFVKRSIGRRHALATCRALLPKLWAMDGGQQVTITFPATAAYLRLARLAASDAGSRAGLDFEEIDDLRIAVSECCILLSGTGTMITLDFVQESGGLVVSGSAPVSTPLELNELSRAIIEAVVDEHELAVDDGIGSFRIVKRARALL
jgi:serine/threonine-protein kinase RsbW